MVEAAARSQNLRREVAAAWNELERLTRGTLPSAQVDVALDALDMVETSIQDSLQQTPWVDGGRGQSRRS